MEISNDQSKELTTINPRKVKNTPPAVEGKAAKIQRLKSGFRLCKPQVCFSTAIAPPSLLLYTNNFHNNNLASPVNLVPERRTVTPHAFSSPMKEVKMSKAQQASGDDRASQVSISRKEYGHQQASKCCSSSTTSLPQGAASWMRGTYCRYHKQKTSVKYSSSMTAELKGGNFNNLIQTINKGVLG
ncbi:hypothetical protein KY285_016228 [Solanum tuberosum]|nr:hypothetical protein KY284_016222 [Solanum tuberosum]KAH0701950.1 hypothetical protein KY285_016228 [Solanum tuberosum]